LGKDNGVSKFYVVFGYKGSEFGLRLENKNRKGQVTQIKVNSVGQTKEVPTVSSESPNNQILSLPKEPPPKEEQRCECLKRK
jgi:hypothetical protein